MDYMADTLELIFMALFVGPIILGTIIGRFKKSWEWGVASTTITWGIEAWVLWLLVNLGVMVS